MKKQTAVQWLVDELRKHIQEHGRLDAITIYQLKMKAKAMEKEQIQWAYIEGRSLDRFADSEIYYTSTFGS